MGLFGFVKEDPRIYTKELFSLRKKLRKNGGKLECVYCKKTVHIDLKAIEEQIRRNQEIAYDVILGRQGNIQFYTSLDQGAVCKSCRGVLCSECSSKANRMAIFAVLCPKCHNPIEGIDHITD